MRARLMSRYRSQYRDPLHFEAGQLLRTGVRDEAWPAFVWVSTDNGRAGWAPMAWLQPLDDGRAIAQRPYCARELDADRGEAVTLHYETGGWWWSERADGTQGWLPGHELELLEETLV